MPGEAEAGARGQNIQTSAEGSDGEGNVQGKGRFIWMNQERHGQGAGAITFTWLPPEHGMINPETGPILNLDGTVPCRIRFTRSVDLER